MMSLISDLRNVLSDEREAVCVYERLAKRACDEGHDDIYHIFEDLSREEKTHVIMLEDILTSMKCDDNSSTDHTQKE